MSDYLTRLIERSVGSAPQIEPLIAPLHAPSDQLLSESVENSAEFEAGPAQRIETSDAAPSPAMTAETGPPPSRTGSQHHQASIPIPEPSTAFPAGKEDDRSLPIQARPKTLLRQTSSTRRPAVETTAASLSRPPSPIAAPVAAVQPETIEQLDRPPSPIAAPAASVQPETIEQLNRSLSPIAAPVSSVEPKIIEQLDPPQEPVRLLRPTPTATKSQIIVQPEIKPATAPSVPARQALSKEPPAIHVTIGRIEVRAVHPPPEPVRRRPAPASTKISLEEYLKERNGGRR